MGHIFLTPFTIILNFMLRAIDLVIFNQLLLFNYK